MLEHFNYNQHLELYQDFRMYKFNFSLTIGMQIKALYGSSRTMAAILLSIYKLMAPIYLEDLPVPNQVFY